ncbi:hypothetical protein UlMin_008794 [Ulmus minor]
MGIFSPVASSSNPLFLLQILQLNSYPIKKGYFHHSSFLVGAATTAAERLVACEGVLKAIWPYSGHYHPTEENFREFISFLEENHVDLSNVKRCAIDDEYPSNNCTPL